MSTRRAMIALSTVTFALLVNEIMLSAIFNVTIGAVNTVVAISAALLGLSASGIVVYLSPPLRARALDAGAVHGWLTAFVIATFCGVLVIMNLPMSHADFSYAPSWGLSALRFAAYCAAILPFFVGGICINLLLLAQAPHIARMYAADLGGAAAGCLAAVAMLTPLGAPRAILFATIPVASIGVWHALMRRPRAWMLVGALLAPFVVVEAADRMVPLLRVKRFNTLGAVDAPSFRGFWAGADALDFERWSLDAWTVIRSEHIPQQWENFRGWGVSKRFTGHVPRLRLVNYNLRFTTYATEFDGDTAAIGEWLDSDLISLHYLLGRHYARVLNVGAGGGREVLNALHHDADAITAVDISGVVVNDLMRDRLRAFSGNLFFHPKVQAIADEGRSFIRRSREQYDLIDFTIVGGTNLEKLDVMNVDDLFTLEALRTYVDKLSPAGVFSYVMYNMREDLVSEWVRHPVPAVPYIPAMKTVAGFRGVFEERFPGMRFADHVLVAGLHGVIDPHYDLVHMIVSVAPFTAAERARFLEECRANEFVPFYPADAATQDNLYQRIIEAPSVAAFDAGLPFSVSPATDDRPFQYAFRWRSARDAALALLANPIVSTGVVFGLLAVLLCFGPLASEARETQQDVRELWRLLGYFAGIGCGYMLIEIAVLLKMQVYLGRPVLALSVGLFAFLLASGIGSRTTARVAAADALRAVCITVAVVVGYGLLLRALWPVVSETTFGLETWARALIAVAVMAPLAFAMGRLFPLGVRLIGDERRAFLPWAWATNGCCSVFGIFAGRVAGLFWGFDQALSIGFAAYLFTAACAVAHVRARRAALRAA